MNSRELESGGIFKVYTATADTDFQIDYPGYTAAHRKKTPRQILFVGGALVVTLGGGGNITLPASLAGVPLNIRPVAMVNAGSGFSALLVIW